MNSDNSTISQLREMISLEEQRENLVREIRICDARLVTLRGSLNFNRPAIPVKPDLSGAKYSSRAGHGSLKREILSLLQKAGPEGISVREVSAFLAIKSANIYAWFHSTGRTIPQISKIGEARYALTGELPPEPEPKPRRDAGRSTNQPRGGLTKKIFAAMTQAGKAGITVKDLADQVESNYRNVAVWFATTGKKFTNIEKLAPAHYRVSETAADAPKNEEPAAGSGEKSASQAPRDGEQPAQHEHAESQA